MRRLVLLLALGLVAVMTAPAGPAAASWPAHLDCARSGSTRVATKQARVFQRKSVVYACLRATGRVFVLGGEDNVGSSSGGDITGPVRLKGELVGYAVTSGAQGTHFYSVAVRNLRTGRFLHRFTAVPSAYYSVGVGDLALTRGGSLAWTADLIVCTSQGCDTPYTTYVLKDDANGVSIVDAAPLFRIRHLEATGETVRWTHGGAPRELALVP